MLAIIIMFTSKPETSILEKKWKKRKRKWRKKIEKEMHSLSLKLITFHCKRNKSSIRGISWSNESCSSSSRRRRNADKTFKTHNIIQFIDNFFICISPKPPSVQFDSLWCDAMRYDTMEVVSSRIQARWCWCCLFKFGVNLIRQCYVFGRECRRGGGGLYSSVLLKH